MATIFSIWLMVLLPGKRGLPSNISAKTKLVDDMSNTIVAKSSMSDELSDELIAGKGNVYEDQTHRETKSSAAVLK